MRESGKTRTIAFSSLKGGTGKTTLAFNLAERACSSGLRTGMVDYDPQEGNIGLGILRGDSSWPVMPARVGASGAELLASLKREGAYDFLVCDLPGSESMALGRLLMEADLVFCPIGFGATDIQAADNFSWMLKSIDLPVVFLASMMAPGQLRRRQLLSEVAAMGIEICPVMIQRRMAQVDAIREGLGVCEAFPVSKAAQEVNDLWDWVRQRLAI